jgi:uncharacterized protein YndB with AHSA1/START domain
MTVIHASFTIERTYRHAPARVFSAFADPEAHARWFVKGEGFVIADMVHDFRVGGHEVGRFGQTEAGPIFVNDTWYLDIVENARIVMAYTMSMVAGSIDGGPPSHAPFSASLATIEIIADGKGTRLVFTEQSAFFEGADGPEMRKAGWTSLLDALGRELDR